MRLDQKIQEELSALWQASVSRGVAGRLIQSGIFTINGEVVKKKSFTFNPHTHFIEWDQGRLDEAYREYSGKSREVAVAQHWSAADTPHQVQDEALGNATPLDPTDIIDETEDYLVVYKPPGVYSHPGIGTGRDTLLDRVYSYLRKEEAQYIPRGGLVHRLDKETQGLVLFAKNLASYNEFREQFDRREVVKLYMAFSKASVSKTQEVFHSVPPEALDVDSIQPLWNILARRDFIDVEGYISRSRQDRQRMVFQRVEGTVGEMHRDGRWAKSRIWPLSLQNGAILLAVQIFTGRTHQIRTQLKALALPIINDPLYGVGWDSSFVGNGVTPNVEVMNLAAVGLQFMHQGQKKSYVEVQRFLTSHNT